MGVKILYNVPIIYIYEKLKDFFNMHWYMYVGMLKMYWKHDLENLHVMYIQCNLISFKLSFPSSNFSLFFSNMNVWKSFRFRTLKWKQTSFHKRKLLVFIYTVHNIKWILKWFKTILLSTRTCTCITWISYCKVILEIYSIYFAMFIIRVYLFLTLRI